MMFHETQNYTNEELNVLKKHYNGNEALWNQQIDCSTISSQTLAQFHILPQSIHHWPLCTSAGPNFSIGLVGLGLGRHFGKGSIYLFPIKE